MSLTLASIVFFCCFYDKLMASLCNIMLNKYFKSKTLKFQCGSVNIHYLTQAIYVRNFKVHIKNLGWLEIEDFKIKQNNYKRSNYVLDKKLLHLIFINSKLYLIDKKLERLNLNGELRKLSAFFKSAILDLQHFTIVHYNFNTNVTTNFGKTNPNKNKNIIFESYSIISNKL